MDQDPLLPRLAGKTLIVKDADALLASPPDEALKALRDAYDANAKMKPKQPLKIGRIMILKRGMKLTLDGKDVFYNGAVAGSFIKVLVPGTGTRSEERQTSIHDVRVPCPDWATYLTLDEMAETVDGLGEGMVAKLWQMLGEISQAKRTPLGGDGTDGTVETPDGRQGDFADKLAANWDAFGFLEQALMVDCYVAQYGEES